MKLLLVFLLAMVVIGLSTERMTKTTYASIVLVVAATITVYFSLQRFMV